jgi:hypothetical protein
MQAGLVYAQEFSSTANVEIVKGASDQNNGQFYVPAETQISAGQIMIIRFTLWLKVVRQKPALARIHFLILVSSRQQALMNIPLLNQVPLIITVLYTHG